MTKKPTVAELQAELADAKAQAEAEAKLAQERLAAVTPDPFQEFYRQQMEDNDL